MRPRCRRCGLLYERESGFFLGAIYFNYGMTAVVSGTLYPLLLFGTRLERDHVLWITLAVVILLPIWFFRYARSLWLAFDYLVDRPEPPGSESGPSRP